MTLVRQMLDCTHDKLPAALPAIRQLNVRTDVVAAYVTGSPNIVWTPADFAQLPAGITVVVIDQAFTGSPAPKANIIDVESGAFAPVDVDHRASLVDPVVERFTVYGSPAAIDDIGHSEHWRGDVWIAQESTGLPQNAPGLPAGFHCIGQQWDFSHPEYDRSVLFDAYWPAKPPSAPVPQPPPGQWHDANAWTWVRTPFAPVIIGFGLDGKIHVFEFQPDTGQWSRLT